MSSFVQYVPAIVQAFGTKSTGDANAAALKQQARVADDQALADEQTQRRQGRQYLGMTAAALAEAGVGYSGSGADLLQQSATNAELDALNIRYQGLLRRRGLEAESSATRRNAGLLAGAQLLTGFSNAYARS